MAGENTGTSFEVFRPGARAGTLQRVAAGVIAASAEAAIRHVAKDRGLDGRFFAAPTAAFTVKRVRVTRTLTVEDVAAGAE